MDNIEDGISISICEVADGALNEVHSILHRMEELAVQAANETLTDSDRSVIDSEVQQLKEEINVIGTDTTFNSAPVFREAGKIYAGSLDNPTSLGEFFKVLGSDTSSTHYMQEPLTPADVDASTSTMNTKKPYVSVHIDFKNVIKDPDNKIQKLIGTSYYVNCCTHCCPDIVTFTDDVGVKRDGGHLYISLKKDAVNYYDDPEEFCKMLVVDNKSKVVKQHVEYAYKGSKLFIYNIDNNDWSDANKKSAYFCDVPGSASNQFSAFKGLYIQMSQKEGDDMLLEMGELSTDTLNIKNTNCLPFASAEKMITEVSNATDILSRQRSRIGAYTNRLTSGYNVNGLTQENTQKAESLIRDTDMADVMVAYSAFGILQQTGEAMLAQANQSKQGVLQLLQ